MSKKAEFVSQSPQASINTMIWVTTRWQQKEKEKSCCALPLQHMPFHMPNSASQFCCTSKTVYFLLNYFFVPSDLRCYRISSSLH